MKECVDCKVIKPFTEFYKRGKVRYEKYKNTSAGYHLWCKECNSIRRHNFYIGNATKVKDQDRNSKLKSAYGITITDFNEMLVKQQGCCAICKCKPEQQNNTDKRRQNLSIDHCHTTGKVRGLLCTGCNLALGYVKDNPNTLKEMINYLLR